jgi:SAM-dependent methyltransferase
MTNIVKYINKEINLFPEFYNKLSNWGKLLILLTIFIILITYFRNINKKNKKEGFQQSNIYVNKYGPDVYDEFYSEIYDDLVFDESKDSYELAKIIDQTTPTPNSIILDVGCGTGRITKLLENQGLHVVGIDNSQAMINKALSNYPQGHFVKGNVLNSIEFPSDSFTHILCLNYTIYYLENKEQFFNNCIKWLMPGGYLALHLVNRETFDSRLPVGKGGDLLPKLSNLSIPLPQIPILSDAYQLFNGIVPHKSDYSNKHNNINYAKNRNITKAKFENFEYEGKFQLDKNKNQAKFIETFKNYDDSKNVRKNEHTYYMESQKSILYMAQDVGFMLEGIINLMDIGYDNQYLYILIKPN